jgi:RNA polymerase sigma-70 factor (ECF subfamily)
MTLRNQVESQQREPSDVSLLQRAGYGDETAFLEIYNRYRDSVYRFVVRLVSSTHVAEDITQECFLSVLRNPARFDGSRASLRTYLIAAARNLAFKRFSETGGEVELDSINFEPAATSREPLAEMLDEELSEVVRRAVESLPPLQREALILFEFEELALAEIAAIVNSDIGTVKSRLHRARQRLKQLLAPYYKDGAYRRAANEVLR